jgi:Ca2+/Na+ antiporter
MSMESAPDRESSPRADLLSSLAWTAFGAAVFVLSWRMDRLENLHINKYEIPGLVPGMLGAAIVLLGIVLALRSLQRGALRPEGASQPRPAGERRYVAIVLGAMIVYPLVLVGRGLPFWLATLLFVATFIFCFDRERQQGLGRSNAKQAVLALVYGAATSAVVTLVFQEIFYVRLP